MRKNNLSQNVSTYHTNNLFSDISCMRVGGGAMFKIEVFNVFQMRFGPSKCTSLKTTPNWKWRRHLKSSIYSARHKNQQVQGIVNTRRRVRWLILNSSHCTGNMYHIIMHKFSMSFVIHFCILGLMSWIWTNPSAEILKFESPSKWNSILNTKGGGVGVFIVPSMVESQLGLRWT